jgi:hypothetical protein
VSRRDREPVGSLLLRAKPWGRVAPGEGPGAIALECEDPPLKNGGFSESHYQSVRRAVTDALAELQPAASR